MDNKATAGQRQSGGWTSDRNKLWIPRSFENAPEMTQAGSIAGAISQNLI
jgi:hypothetical protein